MRTLTLACCLALTASPVLAQPFEKPDLRGVEPAKPNTGPLPVATLPILLEGPQLAPGTVADAATQVGVTVKRLKPGSRVTVTSVLAPAGACRFLPAAGAALPTATADGAGTAVLQIKGVFSNTGAVTGPCTLKATMTAVRSDGEAQQPTLESSRITLAQPQVYVLTDTADWLPKFNFRNTRSAGDCTGSSNAIGGGIYRVGLVTSEGSQALKDVTIRVRSGPAGTHCEWKSDAVLLPPGVKLVEMAVTETDNTKCTGRLNGFQSGKFTGGGFRSDANPVATPAGETLAANPGGPGNPVYGVLPLTVTIGCDATATNDRFANLTIDSMTFTGPPGLSFP